MPFAYNYAPLGWVCQSKMSTPLPIFFHLSIFLQPAILIVFLPSCGYLYYLYSLTHLIFLSRFLPLHTYFILCSLYLRNNIFFSSCSSFFLPFFWMEEPTLLYLCSAEFDLPVSSSHLPSFHLPILFLFFTSLFSYIFFFPYDRTFFFTRFPINLNFSGNRF